VEFADPAPRSTVRATWRPHEALSAQTFDQIVRNVNRKRTSPVRQANGKRARLQFAVATGDLIDSQQLNEVRWYLRVLEGGPLDPFSGKFLGPTNRCPGATQAEGARLNRAVNRREYTGVQDHDDYPGEPAERYADFWDPDVRAPGGPHADFPRYPGLMERAQRPFRAEGLRLPWYATLGNHDGLVRGERTAEALWRSVATGCRKVFPSEAFDPAGFTGTASALDARFASLRSESRLVPPDPARRFVSKLEFKRLHGGENRGHGFGLVSPTERKRSATSASYYAWTPRRGFRFIALDTVADGGGARGNIDDPQYRWLQRELDLSSSYTVTRTGRIFRDRDKDRLIVLYGHHNLGQVNNRTPDETAGRCASAIDPGCDRDPRLSRPLHFGYERSRSVRDLLFRYPNAILYVSGHLHRNDVRPFFRADAKGGFWQLNTAAHIDFPQQSRLIEVMDNRDGTLSVFGTMLNHGAPIAAPASGSPGARFSDRQLASLSRLLAANDPHRRDVTGGVGLGRPHGRNVEVILKDPRRLGRRPRARR
jgi:metallophosphoesterase (TIGR03767 family)